MLIFIKVKIEYGACHVIFLVGYFHESFVRIFIICCITISSYRLCVYAFCNMESLEMIPLCKKCFACSLGDCDDCMLIHKNGKWRAPQFCNCPCTWGDMK